MKNKDPKISFYNSTAVYTVLKRYTFSDNEKQVIQAAILTAKKEKPNMQLINDADTLLGTITTSQSPLEIPEDDMEIKKGSIRIKCRKSAIITKVPKKIGGQYDANQAI